MSKQTFFRIGLVVMALAIVIAALRYFFIPPWIQSHVDKHLSLIEDYDAKYRDIRISVIAGSFQIEQLEFTKAEAELPDPFIQIETATFSVEWKSLMRASLVADVELINPRVNFIRGNEVKESQTSIRSNWIEAAKGLSMLPVNTFTVKSGTITFNDYHTSPTVSIAMSNIDLHCRNLFNVNEEERILSGEAAGTANINDATLRLDVQLNTFYKTPTFDLTAELEDLNLTDLRDLLYAYTDLEVEEGLFSLYTKAATENNRITGYAKPSIEEVTITASEKDDRTYELVKPSDKMNDPELMWLFSKASTDKLSKIDFEGSLADTTLTLVGAIGMTLHSAFVESLLNTLEKSVASGEKEITPKRSVIAPAIEARADKEKKKGFLRRIFGKKDKDRKKGKDG